MKILFLLMCFLMLLACVDKSKKKITLYTADAQSYKKFINEKPLSNDPNLNLDKTIVNNDYPIEIALYSDNKFFYNLPNLGSGRGTWSHKDGIIELKAKRPLFDMHLELYGGDSDISTAALQFSDRFGPNTLRMENNNL